MRLAVNTGNRTQAEQELTGIKKFLESRQSKLAAATEAQALAKQSGQKQQIAFDPEQGWYIPSAPLSQNALKANAGLTVHSGSTALVTAIGAETQAIQAVHDQMEAAYDYAFTPAKNDKKDKNCISPAHGC